MFDITLKSPNLVLKTLYTMQALRAECWVLSISSLCLCNYTQCRVPRTLELQNFHLRSPPETPASSWDIFDVASVCARWWQILFSSTFLVGGLHGHGKFHLVGRCSHIRNTRRKKKRITKKKKKHAISRAIEQIDYTKRSIHKYAWSFRFVGPDLVCSHRGIQLMLCAENVRHSFGMCLQICPR